MSRKPTLAEALERKNMTQAKLVEMTGISASVISRTYHRETVPTLGHLVKIAEAVRMSVEAIDWTRSENGRS